MFQNIFRKSVRSRVLEVMERRIMSAEKKHNDGCKTIDADAEARKEQLAQQLANEVLFGGDASAKVAGVAAAALAPRQ